MATTDETPPAPSRPFRVAAVGDLHARADGSPSWHGRFDGIEREADILVLAGDLTTSGHPREAERVIRALSSVPLKKIIVMGNHEHDHGQADEVVRIFRDGGLIVLDGENNTVELDGGIGIVGAKGFCGGFGAATLAPFGERAIKAFVDEAVHEALQLEVGLRKLASSSRKIVVLHYSPIKETLVGEPSEIYPFLGSSRFAETIDRFGASVCFHGHAHHGSLAGKTPAGTPVFNVALPVVTKALGRPYLIHDVA